MDADTNQDSYVEVQWSTNMKQFISVWYVSFTIIFLLLFKNLLMLTRCNSLTWDEADQPKPSEMLLHPSFLRVHNKKWTHHNESEKFGIGKSGDVLLALCSKASGNLAVWSEHQVWHMCKLGLYYGQQGYLLAMIVSERGASLQTVAFVYGLHNCRYHACMV
jgi:hypothetical protein